MVDCDFFFYVTGVVQACKGRNNVKEGQLIRQKNLKKRQTAARGWPCGLTPYRYSPRCSTPHRGTWCPRGALRLEQTCGRGQPDPITSLPTSPATFNRGWRPLISLSILSFADPCPHQHGDWWWLMSSQELSFDFSVMALTEQKNRRLGHAHPLEYAQSQRSSSFPIGKMEMTHLRSQRKKWNLPNEKKTTIRTVTLQSRLNI